MLAVFFSAPEFLVQGAKVCFATCRGEDNYIPIIREGKHYLFATPQTYINSYVSLRERFMANDYQLSSFALDAVIFLRTKHAKHEKACPFMSV